MNAKHKALEKAKRARSAIYGSGREETKRMMASDTAKKAQSEIASYLRRK